MGIRSGRNRMRSAQLDQKEETIILRSCHEKRRRLSEERDHAGHCSANKKARRPKMRWMDDMEKWAKMSFEKLLKETENRWRWHRLIHEATNPRNEDG